jgi:hypothetical protein
MPGSALKLQIKVSNEGESNWNWGFESDLGLPQNAWTFVYFYVDNSTKRCSLALRGAVVEDKDATMPTHVLFPNETAPFYCSDPW